MPIFRSQHGLAMEDDGGWIWSDDGDFDDQIFYFGAAKKDEEDSIVGTYNATSESNKPPVITARVLSAPSAQWGTSTSKMHGDLPHRGQE